MRESPQLYFPTFCALACLCSLIVASFMFELRYNNIYGVSLDIYKTRELEVYAI